MTRVVFDAAMQAKLGDGATPVEFCDESGGTVGHYLPRETYQRLVYEWANSQVSDEELERCLNEPGGKTLAEIMANLRPS